MSKRLALPGVTLCAATSVNLEATLAALRQCLAMCEFGDAILFTDQPVEGLPTGLRRVEIGNLSEAAAYSQFMIEGLVHQIRTDHALVVQWDGFICSPDAWDESFLDYDYIGAVWPQFSDSSNVGNGGFSLRSKRLLKACMDPRFVGRHPEDVAICRVNRPLLEEGHGIRFADAAVARKFSFERESADRPTFGFHGVFNMPSLLGCDRFWQAYESLEDRRSVFHDAWLIAFGLGPKRGLALLRDYLRFRLAG